MASHETASAQGSAWGGGTEPFKASYGKLMMWYFLLSDAFTFAGFLIAYGALRFSNPAWPLPDFVFKSAPGLHVDPNTSGWPLLFVTVMSFVLIVSSVTMVRAVQEGHRENKSGVIRWLLMTIVGGACFLGCQAVEWNHLLHEGMSIYKNPFATHTVDGAYVDAKGAIVQEFSAGDSYQLLPIHDDHGHSHDVAHDVPKSNILTAQVTDAYTGEAFAYEGRVFKIKGDDGKYSTDTYVESFGPKAFGALFYCITGFHGFHVLSGLIILLIILLNVVSGLYVDRKNGYEMVEKVGLYWHFVDLVWVFVFLAFYLL